MRTRMIIKSLPWTAVLAALPFLACLALPLAIFGGGGWKQAARCGTCRAIAAIMKDDNIRLC